MHFLTKNRIELVHPTDVKREQINVSCLSFPKNETSSFWVGTEEGIVYQANRFDRAGSKSGIDSNGAWKAHSGLVTGIKFHPNAEFSHLFLTSSIDWTVKLWKNVRFI